MKSNRVSRSTEQKKRLTVEESIAALLSALSEVGPAILEDPNFIKTPKRVAAYFREHFRTIAQVDAALHEIRTAVFPSHNKEMIVQRDIVVHGICPHHLLPVYYNAAVAYIPSGKVIGLSKLSRIAELYLSRPELQETATVDVANALELALQTKDVAVLVEGRHSCMSIRGVKSANSTTVTVELQGAFNKVPMVRAEFYAIVNRSGN